MALKRYALSLALAVVLFAGIGLAGGAGVALAHPDANPNFQGEHSDDPHPSPVGQNAFDDDHPGEFKGFAGVNPDTEGNAVEGITHNPNCPLHHH